MWQLAQEDNVTVQAADLREFVDFVELLKRHTTPIENLWTDFEFWATIIAFLGSLIEATTWIYRACVGEVYYDKKWEYVSDAISYFCEILTIFIVGYILHKVARTKSRLTEDILQGMDFYMNKNRIYA
jgi:hypothetical protein